MRWQKVLTGLLATLSLSCAQAATLDESLVSLSELILAGQFESAHQLAQQTRDSYPGSRAAQLIKADLHNIAAGRLASMDPTVSFSPQLLEILNELKKRRRHAANKPPIDAVPDILIQPSARTRHIIAVDQHASRLYLLERDTDGRFTVSEDHYISIGLGGSGKLREGDLRTPVGIYDIDGFKTDQGLPRLYGSGAFTLDFPNELDRQRGITGSGIWLHGMPHDQLSRPPQDSEGCVVMRNDLITHLRDRINTSTTPVILAQELNWVPYEQLTLPPSPPWHQAGHASYDTLAFNQAGVQPLSELFAGSGNSDTEVYRYPLTQKNMHGALYRVRILQSSPDKSLGEPLALNAFWTYDEQKRLWLAAELPKPTP